MQIHELNNNKKSLNEVDFFGPQGIVATGKQLFKNPASLVSNTAQAQSDQDAVQASAAKSAQKLAKQGYKVSNVPEPATIDQQLKTVRSSTPVQQQVKTLTANWMTQSAALKRKPSVSEAAVQFDPKELSDDPKYANILKAMQAQGVDPAKEAKLEKDLSAWESNFLTWADARVSAQGITLDDVNQNPEMRKLLKDASTKVAVAAQSGNDNLEKQAVEEFFNIAIAGIQVAYRNQSQRSRPQAAATPTAATATPAMSQNILQQLNQQGVNLSQTDVQQLGKAMIASANGNRTVRDTGNSVLNALAKLAGMTVK